MFFGEENNQNNQGRWSTPVQSEVSFMEKMSDRIVARASMGSGGDMEGYK
jgi:hypothetical protein